MRIATWNVNGLRAAWKKGLWPHLKRLDADAVMLQEIRCLPDQAPAAVHRQRTYKTTWHPAERKGYAGTLTWTRTEHEVVSTGLGAADPEGRVLVTQWSGLTLINVYLPSGSRSTEAQERKDQWAARFQEWVRPWVDRTDPVILGGDLNIAHTRNDIHNPTGNKNNSGFLEHERAWFGALLDTGWTDLLRRQLGERKGPYSWWSNRGQARKLDRGWRIDYLLGNAAAADRLTDAGIVRKGGLVVSDHAPVWVDLAD